MTDDATPDPVPAPGNPALGPLGLQVRVLPTRPYLTARMDGDCNVCKGDGYTATPEAAAEGALAICRCTELKRRVRLLNASRLPWIAGPADIRRMQPPAQAGDAATWNSAWRAICDTVNAGQGGVTLVGPAGTGKSWLLFAAIRWACMSRGQAGLYVSARDAIGMLRVVRQVSAEEGVSTSGGTPPESEIMAAMAYLRSVPVLALDEVGHQRVPFARDIVTQTICGRWDDGRPTLVASNHDPDTLREPLGESVVDRLFTGSRAFFFAGESRRSPPAGATR